MNLRETTEERRLRDEVRGFLREHCPAPEDVPYALDERMEFLREWQRLCYEAGYVGRAWPAEFGGRGRPPVEQIIVDEELAAAGAPEFPNIVGLDVIGPSLLAFGDDAQRERYVPPILSAEEIWCQGFSEPDAGSDLGSLRTRAISGGEEFVVSGQKTWTSWGQYARWCGVLARTEPPETRHRGISFLIVDMQSQGVEVRPMTQITGHAEFSELFLEDVVVPRENLLGMRGQGWEIALHTLAHERGTAALPRQVKLRTWVDRLATEACARSIDGRPIADHEDTQRALARALIAVEVLRHHASRTVGAFLDGRPVGPESSTVKLVMAEAEQRVGTTALEVLGESLDAPERLQDDAANAFWYETYLFSRTATILGGTQQIQRNIVADRILQLPQGIVMDLELTDEQTWLAQSVEQLLAQSPGPETWPALVEFGALAIASGEDGLGAVELALVARALGQSLSTVPFLETAAARYATRAYASPQHPAFAGLHGGEDIVALGLLEPGAGWELVGCTTSVKSRNGGDVAVIEGHKVAVHHANIARELLVLYNDGEDRRLALIERDSTGVKLTPTASIDESLPTAAVELAGVGVPDTRSLGPEQSEAVLARLVAIGGVLAAGEAVGAAATLVELARDYAGQRRQFGRSIASFQALRHLLADMHVKQTSAWSTVLFAAAGLEDGIEGAERTASIAKAYASRATLEVAHGALQVFGGIAFTAEHPAHRFLRRILVRGGQFGDARHHERLIGCQLVAAARREELVG